MKKLWFIELRLYFQEHYNEPALYFLSNYYINITTSDSKLKRRKSGNDNHCFSVKIDIL